jgi:3-isopropylmalate/(R)-2-methylmalate dehydratase large subunit
MPAGRSQAHAKTLSQKIWESHVVASEQDIDLLYIDVCLVHDNSKHAFEKLAHGGHAVRHPEQVFAFSDHYVPSARRDHGIADPAIRNMVEFLQRTTAEKGIRHFGLGDPNQGILHVVPPEQGITQPGIVIGGADSHTSTHGALGCVAFGIGASEAAHILATQTLWQRRPKAMRITADGSLAPGVEAKDLILAIIARIGIGGATGHIVEYAGSAIRGFDMYQRMTVCNMSIEAGARAGLIAPDDRTFTYLAGRPYAPKGAAWDRALTFWRALASDGDAPFDRELSIDAAKLAPMVSWGTNPEHTLPITDEVPDPARCESSEKKAEFAAALNYMGLVPKTPLASIKIDRVFIGSCTNSRLEDLRAAATVARRGRAMVPTWVVPGSAAIKRQAEAEGLDRVFREAGFEWREPGCSLCTALNGDQLKPGERCASTSNRNFPGRQGVGGRTHLMSPSMAAMAALSGRLADVRQLV